MRKMNSDSMRKTNGGATYYCQRCKTIFKGFGADLQYMLHYCPEKYR